MANYGKTSMPVAFAPTSAFPLDVRTYFENYEDAINAATNAKEVGSTDSVYYYGQELTVYENGEVRKYIIQPDNTLSPAGLVEGEGEHSFVAGLDTIARSAASTAYGYQTEAGSKAFEFDIEVDADGNVIYDKYVAPDAEGKGKYYLTSVEGILDALAEYENFLTENEAAIEAGEISQRIVDNHKVYYTIILGGNYDYQGEIVAVDTNENTITVTNYIQPKDRNIFKNHRLEINHSYLFLPNYPECGTMVIGTGATAVGYQTKARSIGAYAEGCETMAEGKYSHAEGKETQAGYAGHAEGWHTKTTGAAGHAENYGNEAIGNYSHAEGLRNRSIGGTSHVEGENNLAQGARSHAEGYETKTEGTNSHAEGRKTITKGENAHAEGSYTQATGKDAHAEGQGSTDGIKGIASGEASHIEGYNNIASAKGAHAEGGWSEANGKKSHAEGTTAAAKDLQHTEGRYNKIDNKKYVPSKSNDADPNRGAYVHIIGNGDSSSNTERSNAHTVDWKGNAWYAGNVYVGGTEAYDLNDGNGVQTDAKRLVTSDELNALAKNLFVVDLVADIDKARPLFIFTTTSIDENGYDGTGKLKLNADVFFAYNNKYIYLGKGGTEYEYKFSKSGNLKAFICEYDNNGTTTLSIKNVANLGTLTNKYSILLIFNAKPSQIRRPHNVSYKGTYEADGVIYNNVLSSAEASLQHYDIIKYVSTSGNDGNNGNTKETAYATIQKAIDSGATIIHVKPDTYIENPTSTTEKLKLHILADWEGNASTGRKKVVLNYGTELTISNEEEGLKYVEYSSNSDYMKNAFINFDTIKTYGDYNRGDGTIVSLWKKGNDYRDQEKLTPEKDLDSCKANDESWFYDGTKIYVNTTHTGSFILSSENNKGCLFENIDELVLEDIEVNYPTYCGFEINNCNNVKVINCGGQFAGKRNGFLTNNINGTFENCYGNRNANDGFAPCGVGNTIFTNCEAHYNYDDGISHHDGCTGAIQGGYYSYNGKGGVSPAHGSIVNCYNVISNYNKQNGFYLVDGQSGDYGRKMLLKDCHAEFNKLADIKISNYQITATDCYFDTRNIANNENTSFLENNKNIENTANAFIITKQDKFLTINDNASTDINLNTSTIFEPIQEGEPSPEAPAAINPYNELTLYRQGKNLIPFPYADQQTDGNPITRNGLTFTVLEDGSIKVNGTATATTDYKIMYSGTDGAGGNLIKLPKGTKAFLSGCPSTGGATTYQLFLRDANRLADTGQGIDLTNVLNNDEYIDIWSQKLYIRVVEGVTVNNVVFKPQIEIGTIATAYEPYQAPDQFKISLGQDVFGGKFNWTSGELEITHKEKIITGDDRYDKNGDGSTVSSWYWYSQTRNFVNTECFCLEGTFDKKIGWKTSICNMFDNTGNPYPFTESLAENGTYTDHSILENLYFAWGEKGTTLEDWQNFLRAQYAAGNPLKVVYELAEPIKVQLTPKYIEALKDTTTLYSTEGETSVTYNRDINKVIKELQNAIISLGGNI